MSVSNPTTTENEMSSVRVMLWCAPRSTSNLFARSLTEIEGNEVWIEPYQYACFALNEMKKLKVTEQVPMEYEGNEDTFKKAAAAMSAFLGSPILPERLPYATVKHSLENSSSKYVFVKDMGVAMQSDRFRHYLPHGYKHTFLIRHPTLAYRSYRKALYNQLLAIGQLGGEERDEHRFDIETYDQGMPVTDFYIQNYELWKYVRTHIDPNPIVVESHDLLSKPAEVLSNYCKAVGLPYSDSLLTWDTSPASYKTWKLAGDHILDNAVNFVGSLMKTTHFMAPSEPLRRDQLTNDVINISDAVMPYYKEMYQSRLTV